ncbi:MAG: FUSC family protein, partial [Francisella endosymbiont of Hyalomma scupense]
IAITLALGISMSLDLDKPMWAMFAALFLQTRPETGFIIEKAVVLISASIIGVGVGFLIVDFFLPYPVLALLALCLFIAITMFFSANMSHPNFMYALAIANTTCNIVVFYSIADPAATTSESVFHTGYSRVTEMAIGSLCSCFVNYYILPMKVEKTLTNHETKGFDLTINYIKEMFSTQDFSNNQKYNLKVENILNSLVALDNDLSAAKYENITKTGYVIFSNKLVELIQAVHFLRKHLAKKDDDSAIKKDLENIVTNLDKLDLTQYSLVSSSSNHLIKKVIKRINNLLHSYQELFSTSNKSNNKESSYSFINYTNPAVTFIAISRTICLLLCEYLVWIHIDGNSSLLMMMIFPCLLSQISIAAPNPANIIKNVVIGLFLSIPISIFITLNLLSQVVGYFELLILVLLGGLLLGIATLAHPKYQMHSLGFCIGFISIIQPSNHMDFEVAKSFTIGISIIVGAIGLWLAFKLYPQSPYTISRKIAIKSIIKDIQKLKKRQISKEHYQAGLIKKILSVYKNRKDDAASERDIEFALQSLIQTI